MLEQAYEDFAAADRASLRPCHPAALNVEQADTVFVARWAAPLQRTSRPPSTTCARHARCSKSASIHVNVLRPFPETAPWSQALQAASSRVIVLERTDGTPGSGDNPLSRVILRTALGKAQLEILASIRTAAARTPAVPCRSTRSRELFSGVYGLGSRDFRPEGHPGRVRILPQEHWSSPGWPPHQSEDGSPLLLCRYQPPLRGGAPTERPSPAAGQRHRRAPALHWRLGHDSLPARTWARHLGWAWRPPTSTRRAHGIDHGPGPG